MDAQQIKQFIDAMAASDLAEMEVSHGGWTLRLARGARAGATPAGPALARHPAAPTAESQAASAAGVASAAAVSNSGPRALNAPLYGIVHLQPAPGEPPYACPGDMVEAGQLLCIIEAMKVFNEVRAEQAGRLAKVLVPTGSEVEAGQALMTIEPLA